MIPSPGFLLLSLIFWLVINMIISVGARTRGRSWLGWLLLSMIVPLPLVPFWLPLALVWPLVMGLLLLALPKKRSIETEMRRWIETLALVRAAERTVVSHPTGFQPQSTGESWTDWPASSSADTVEKALTVIEHDPRKITQADHWWIAVIVVISVIAAWWWLAQLG
jgi:hypothetical protein